MRCSRLMIHVSADRMDYIRVFIVYPSSIRAFIMLSRLFSVFVEYVIRAFRMLFSASIRPISVFIIPRILSVGT